MKNALVVFLTAITVSAASHANANLLTNGSFNDPSTAAAPTGWLLWSYGGGWANHLDDSSGFPSVDGSFYMADGGASSAGGGEYQFVPGAAGVTYKLTVDSGAQAWWLPYGEMRMFFMDSSSNQLSESFFATVDPAVYGINYDIAHPWSNFTLTATAPAGTALVKVEFAEPNGTGSVWFDNADLEVVPEPSTLMLAMTGLLAFFGFRYRRS